MPAVLADLLRSLGRSTPLHDRARSAPSPAARADRRAERAVGPIVRPGRTELDALNTQLAILDQDLNADISSISAALRALDQSLPERADTPEDRARLQKLREAANRLGGLVRTQQDVRGRLGAMMRILADLDDTFSALAAERGPADPG